MTGATRTARDFAVLGVSAWLPVMILFVAVPMSPDLLNAPAAVVLALGPCVVLVGALTGGALHFGSSQVSSGAGLLGVVAGAVAGIVLATTATGIELALWGMPGEVTKLVPGIVLAGLPASLLISAVWPLYDSLHRRERSTGWLVGIGGPVIGGLAFLVSCAPAAVGLCRCTW